MLFSGAYGTAENRTRNVAARKGRAVYLLSRAFPSKETMQTLYPVLGRRPLLLPVCWIMRLINAWRTKRQKALSQLRAVFRR